MKEHEQEHVNQAFEYGAASFFEKDLDKVMLDAETAMG